MFDGNHRTRRNINLSSATKRSSRLSRNRNSSSSGTSRSSSSSINSGRRGNASEILEEARKSREVRMLNLKRNKASICIQRFWRGFSARISLVKSLLWTLDETVNGGADGNKDDASVSIERLKRIWQTGTGLLIPSLVSHLSHSIRSSRRNTSESNVWIVSQILLKMEVSLRNFHEQQSISMYQIIQEIVGKRRGKSSPSTPLSTIISFRRIFLHCLIYLQSILRSREQLSDAGNQSKHKAILNLMNCIVQDDDGGNNQSIRQQLIQSIIPMTNESTASTSEIKILFTFTQCCQYYYHKLTTISSSKSSPSPSLSSDKTQYELISYITSNLFKFACLSIPTIQEKSQSQSTSAKSTVVVVSSYSTSAMKYLSAILLGIDLQSCFDTSNIQNDSNPLSPCSIFHQCALYFFTNQGCTTNRDTGSKHDELVDQKLILLLLKSLDGALINSNRYSPSVDGDYCTQFTSNLMSGNELMYIKNSLSLLECKNKKGVIMDDENDYKALCATTIRLVASVMGVHYDSSNIAAGDFELVKSPLNNNTNTSSSSRQTDALNILISLVAKGETINADNLISTASKNSFDDDDDNAMDIDESFENHDDFVARKIAEKDTNHTQTTTHAGTTTTATSKIYASNASRQKRQDLQTVTKLDQLYQSKINRSRQDLHAFLKSIKSTSAIQTLLQVSKAIGYGDLMVELAMVVFPPPQMKKRKNMGDAGHSMNSPLIGEAMVTSMDDLDLMRELFISMLSKTLSYCTGIKSRACAMSPILSKIAFQSHLMEQLWKYTKSSLEHLCTEKNQLLHSKLSVKAFSAASSFCDLFVHNLLAMDDEEFVLSYTTVNSNGTSRSSILITDLVQVLNVHLHNLYWAKPVVVDDVKLPSNCSSSATYEQEACQRARFLLSGTKLWNVLHQRWSRLYSSTKFCDQECWHFPRLVTKGHDEDGAMFDTRIEAAMNANLDDEDEQMMDFDEENEQGRSNVTMADEESDALASSFKDPKMARILTSIPQAIPFDRRVKLFTSLLSADLARMQDQTQAQRQMIRSMMDGEEVSEFAGRINAKIHRDKLYEDSMAQLNKHGTKLRRKVAVTFYNQVGALEAGIDGGGVFREFLGDLIQEAFSPEKEHDNQGPLFVVSPLQTLAVNTRLPPTPQTLSHYQFVGRVLGKAVYESLLVEPQFAYPFLNQLLGQQNTLDDLKNLDPEYYKHLSALRHMSSDEIDSLGLTFELSTPSMDGKSVQTVELIPGGSSMSVTKMNAIRYVHLVAHRRLNIESSKQTNAFLSGFRDLIPAAWVRLFSPYELQRLIGGDDTVKGFDVAGLKAAMQYAGGYHPSQAFMHWFWEIIEEMSAEQQRKFLKFMTSCSRQPLLGFKSLTPLPCVQQIRLSEEESIGEVLEDKDVRLPTSATCANLLKLPNYKSKELMRSKLLYAIESGSGFELS